jgi:undecaprenyl-diphosphatase
VVALALMVFAIKFSIKRRRPEGEWGAIYRKTDPHSFPSGHAARAIMLATAVCGLGPLWLAVVLLVWAPLVCLARVGMGLHYISDVLAGGVLGVAAGLVLLAAAPWITQTFLFLLG